MKDRLVMFLDPKGRGWEMWACRGKGKCLEPAPSKRKHHCKDCVLGKEEETLAQLQARMAALPAPE